MDRVSTNSDRARISAAHSSCMGEHGLIFQSWRDGAQVNINVHDMSEVTINSTRLQFTPDVWDRAQTILVTPLNDNLQDGDMVAKVCSLRVTCKIMNESDDTVSISGVRRDHLYVSGLVSGNVYSHGFHLQL